ncbi:hypothetical protein K0817_009510 [Microbacterium sp. HD4P20]|uniref:hypothetical protein n=1 Tax=Microbacterium sp. HD4P20 TaxID=2864874 RepID=UPI0020A3AF94|nr:hypothetical protein [Microbacterium sp. HD4P20]MCP2636799.1 hypothetical protein [Microbacterium sp. HD4P20]
MSTPEQPATPPLTRKQMREIRNTGSNPVIPPASASEPAPDAGTPAAAPEQSEPVSPAPLPRPSTPAVVPPPPVADSAVDLGVSPLTRRQARQQERIRTASVPVITPEVVAAHAGAPASPAPTFAFPAADRPVEDARSALLAEPETTEPETTEPEDTATSAEDTDAEREDPETVRADSGLHSAFGFSGQQPEPQRAPVEAAFPWAQHETAVAPADAQMDAVPGAEAGATSPFGDLPFAPVVDAPNEAPADDEVDEGARAVVNPLLGAGLLGTAPTVEPLVDLPASFDQLLSRSTGSVSMPNALIVSQAPEVSPLVGPVTATGDVLVTGTFNLPEGLGSTGHARGTADGKEIDATLVDGELPSHSSPTPIAASSAVSTVKTPGEVIKPPVPEKGNRLMMSLAITAGVLALALAGVLILAFVTGVF